MELRPGIKAVGLGLLIEKHATLVLADLHLGIEDAMRKRGVFIPRQHFKELARRVTRILAASPKITRVVLNGDIKHEFGTINEQEWREIKRLINLLRQDDREVVIIKGNHDVMLAPIARDKDIKLVNQLVLGDILIAHGDTVPKSLSGIKTVIIGHEHPTVTLREKAKAETFKCFVVTSYRFKKLIVQPSFGPLTQGMDILKGNFLSPLLGSNVKRGKIFIVNEENDDVLDFGKASKL